MRGISEAQEQMNLMQWANYCKGRYPELELLHHIPNGGSRNRVEAARLKAQGVKAGVPDLFLPVPRGSYHGLYIELKREHGGRVSKEQEMWLDRLTEQGFACSLCRGFEAAASVIEGYLKQDAAVKYWEGCV